MSRELNLEWQRIRHSPLSRRWPSKTAFERWATRTGYRPGRRLHRHDPTWAFSPTNCYWSETRVRSGTRRAWADSRLQKLWNSIKSRATGWPDGRAFERWCLENGYVAEMRFRRRDRCRPHGPDNSVWVARGTPQWKVAISGQLVTAWNEVKLVEDWVADPRCLCSLPDLLRRLSRGESSERAMARLGTRRHQLRFADTKLYETWKNIRRGCRDPKHPMWNRCGGLGATVCPEWAQFPAFYAWALANGYGPGRKLVRDREEDGFSPTNCRWASKRKYKHWGELFEAFGERKSLAEWSRDPRCVIAPATFLWRVYAKRMSVEEAMSKPVNPKLRRHKTVAGTV